jgi:hypothetical protein
MTPLFVPGAGRSRTTDETGGMVLPLSCRTQSSWVSAATIGPHSEWSAQVVQVVL